MMYKSVRGCATVLMLSSMLAACGGPAADEGSATTAPAAEDSATTAPAAEDAEVRVMHAGPVGGGTNVWVPAHHAAYTAVADRAGWNIEVAETVPYGEAAQILNRWGQAGVDTVFLSDNGFQTSMLEAAEQYPDTNFVMMSDLSETNDLPNVAAYTVDWCELGYVLGVPGALVSENNAIGVVASLEILPVKKALAGMKGGAEDAVPGTSIAVEYSGNFVDVEKHQEAASTLIANGADVILGVATLSSPVGVRVQEEGETFIGVFADESASAPEAIATSAVIEFESGYEDVAEQMRNGGLEAGVHPFGYADGSIKLLPFQNGFENEEEKANEILASLAAGDVDLSACRSIAE